MQPQSKPQSREFWALVVGTIVAGAAVLTAVSVPPPEFRAEGLIFWAAITLIAAWLPVTLPSGITATITTAPVLAAIFDPSLPQPFAACWVAFLGTWELRDFRRGRPLYAPLYNRMSWVLSAFAGWIVLVLTAPVASQLGPAGIITQVGAVGAAFAVVNSALGLVAASLFSRIPLRRVYALSVRNILIGLVSQPPLGWLMAQIAVAIGQWAAVLFMVPLLLARYSFSKFTETRELFFGTVSALSQAIDAKDGFTRGHADRVSRIAGAIAREMGLSERQIEQIELAGLLHDIGKIGVEDRILMKPARLELDEKELMQRHPIYGASILEPSAALRPLVPMILHHHENFDGTGYPEGVKGEAIPIGARIIIVSDAYEAMTSDRIYRKAMGHDRAMEQLNKYKGVQFDPHVVRALEARIAKHGIAGFEVSDLPPINYETLAELRKRLARDPLPRDARVG